VTAYYNEIEPYAAQWLRNLIKAGHIADGEVDTRSIVDVRPADLAGFTQCHFFSGIGGWSHALRLAGWPDDRPIWTGSCPCQPFSAAGQRGGVDDARHLWPDFFRLIGERRPPVVFGEQVASKDGLGWLDLVHADMEGAGYALGAVDLCAAGVGTPHIRQRLWFVGERLAHPGHERHEWDSGTGWEAQRGVEYASGAVGLADAVRGGHGEHQRDGGTVGGPASNRKGEKSELGWAAQEAGYRSENGVWADADWLYFRDGKWRAVEPGTFPLAYGIPNRVGRLRAYGNAIVPQVAAEVIKAFMETQS